MMRRFQAPEVIQTSAMDCGPAALKSLLEGHGINVSYGRLREACQTEVDGTSIDVLEDLAVRLGLDATQTMLPFEHLAVGDPFPALLVTKDPVGALHFVVVWRRIGRRFQIMDPGRGRLWVDAATLRQITFKHGMPIPASQWRAWAGGVEAHEAFAVRFARIGARKSGAGLLERARADPSWRSFGALDAALRMTESLVLERAIERGNAASSLVEELLDEALRDLVSGHFDDSSELIVPRSYWSAAPSATPEHIMLSGAVLVRVFGVRPEKTDAPLPAEVTAALRERPPRPLRHLGSILRQDGVLGPGLLLLSLVAATLGGALEALLLRSSIDVGRHLGIPEQRLAGIGVLVALLAILLVLDVSFAGGVLRVGRRLETRLRMAFLRKVPRLHDRYFQSRPASDMAHRCHAIHPVRELPQLGGRIVRNAMDLLVVAAGLVWIDARSWPLVLLAVVVSTAGPWFAQRSVAERDLRARSFDGALTRFYFDSLLGLVALRAHGGESTVRRQHGRVTVEWARASLSRIRASTFIDALQQIGGSSLAVFLVFAYLVHEPEPAAVLLFVYWALNVPVLGQEIARTALLYPSMRNRLLRLMEPLDAVEEPAANEGSQPATGTHSDVAEAHIVFREVSVRAAGHTILKHLDLAIPKGAHVAIVGASGAGKSSLVGLLLGWHRPASGSVLVDGLPLRGDHLKQVRMQTAWVDASVHIWNRSLLANLEYGAVPNGDGRVDAVLEDADLLGLLERLPDGLQTELGEGGALVAGGEGQRVRLGRAMMRKPKLVVLDEAFRGLDRECRHVLTARARERWKSATLLCVTHDVEETRTFDRVIVLDGGRVCEDGNPAELLARDDSRYASMLRAEADVRRTLWNGDAWRKVTVRDGQLAEGMPVGARGAEVRT
ncbi:ATP-binding cassette domain-containing protein [Pendulispora brunnea]|uniref:ATP-binding cassette domain-containing protein n=1 Tax=Pendulispora brunnea TaxID=2905690 RepID=A0ABZ2KAA0_9BACT